MDRDTIIFTGASHTFGLGLEWELDPMLNSEEYLQKGISMPIPRLPHYEKYWRDYRWPSLVCNELGYTQYNVHDREHKNKIGANSVNTLWTMVRDEDKIQSLFARTKYVIIESNGNVRWYDENLHGGKEGYKYPNTVLEMIELINNPESDQSVVEKTLQWILDVDIDSYMIELTNKIKYLIENYPEIKFLILPWHTSNDGNLLIKKNFLKNNIIEISETHNNHYNSYECVNIFLQKNKLQVCNKAKAFNGDYEYNHPEDHASIEGHQRVANMVINHIKKIEGTLIEKVNLI
jgi:hypothetical protein